MPRRSRIPPIDQRVQHFGSSNQIPYNPFFFTAVQFPTHVSALRSPSLGLKFSLAFSLALWLAVPHSESLRTQPRLPWLPFNAEDLSNSKNTVFVDYTVDIEEYHFPGSHRVTIRNNNAILDSGTTLNYVPADVAAAYNAYEENVYRTSGTQPSGKVTPETVFILGDVFTMLSQR
ncbi:hypothetical protein K438DRAFT_1984097 [Mycena galopus ATCC 62051]|nr:hypothetical protein K438DRAFT_1984097 [Mycena galopus ATCC 62051]